MKTQLDKLIESQENTTTGASIVSLGGLPAETTATLHALNSREPGGWRVNIPKMFDEKGLPVERIMDSFYVGYGHKSIGDCGTGDVFVDDCSMLAANALEHSPLFSGQETSSRYVDVSIKGYVPSGDKKIDRWTQKWLEFYSKNLPLVVDYISQNVTCPKDGNKTQWNKAIKSRACDIMGSFLPCGARTNMSIHMNLRQCADFVDKLLYHPLSEVQEITESSLSLLQKTHPNSFSFKVRQSVEDYKRSAAKFIFGGNTGVAFGWQFSTAISNTDLVRFLPRELLERERYTELPHEVAYLGNVNISSLIDYRSFRDLHRHRSAVFRMPIVTIDYGFEQWYLGMLPTEVRTEAVQILQEFEEFYDLERTLDHDSRSALRQYAVPMGYTCSM